MLILSEKQKAQLIEMSGIGKTVHVDRIPSTTREQRKIRTRHPQMNLPIQGSPQQLTNTHNMIVRLKLVGVANTAIATTVGCSAATVSQVLNSNLGKQKLAMLTIESDNKSVDFRAEINKLLPGCLEAFEDALAVGSDIKTRLKAAEVVAGKFAGKATPVQIEQKHLHAHLDASQLEAFKEIGQKNIAKILAPEIVDAEIVNE